MEEYRDSLLESIYKACVGDIGACKDLYGVCREIYDSEPKKAVWWGKRLSELCEERLRSGELSEGEVKSYYELHKQTLLLIAKDDFESYMLYMEWNRDPDKRFYKPRRKQLKRAVEALQRLADGERRLLCISMPPGVGKSTLAIFYLCWLAGKYPDEPMLTGSHSNSFVEGVYKECLRLMDENGEYLWHDIFPTVNVVSTNARGLRIDLGINKRFETLEFTSVGSGNAGLYRASRLLYCDDLVPGLEVALSIERLNKLWETYTTDLRQRKIGDHCGELHIATRWSVHDIIGRLEDAYGDNADSEFIVMPALDGADESNFDYDYGVGFSTEFYREQRSIMDDVSWACLYQNQPIEREGLLYHEDELRRFMELPCGDDGKVLIPDAIIGVCDTKDKGKDYCVHPVGLVYGQDHYIVDCVCDNGLPETVEERLVQLLLKWHVQMSRFESNAAGRRIAVDVQKRVKEGGGITSITTKYTTANKETKIIAHSGWVKEHCLFLDDSKFLPKSDYGKFIKFLTSYTVVGKNKVDDVPDAMSAYSEFAQSLNNHKVEVFARPI